MHDVRHDGFLQRVGQLPRDGEGDQLVAQPIGVLPERRIVQVAAQALPEHGVEARLEPRHDDVAQGYIDEGGQQDGEVVGDETQPEQLLRERHVVVVEGAVVLVLDQRGRRALQARVDVGEGGGEEQGGQVLQAPLVRALVGLADDDLGGEHERDDGAEREQRRGEERHLEQLPRHLLPLREVVLRPARRVHHDLLVPELGLVDLERADAPHVPPRPELRLPDLPGLQEHRRPEQRGDGVHEGVLGEEGPGQHARRGREGQEPQVRLHVGEVEGDLGAEQVPDAVEVLGRQEQSLAQVAQEGPVHGLVVEREDRLDVLPLSEPRRDPGPAVLLGPAHEVVHGEDVLGFEVRLHAPVIVGGFGCGIGDAV